jgi:hypothetical protein
MLVTPVNATVPLPLDNAAIRATLHSSDPAVAFAVALVAVHALTAKQLAQLELTDIVDGRLAVDGQTIALAGPVRVRLTAWLDHRSRTWPATINPHLSSVSALPASPRSASSSRGQEHTCDPKPYARTASSKRSTTAAETSAGSATSSASTSKPPCATPSPRRTPTSYLTHPPPCLTSWTCLRLGR